MANSKISQLTSATTPLAGTETVPVVQSGGTKKVSVSDLTAGRSVSTGDLYSVKTSAGAVVDVATIQNLSSAANTEAALFLAPTSATGNIRGARIAAINDGGNVIGLKFYTGSAGTITSKFEIEGATTGNATLKTGNLVIGTSGKGIDFSVTSQAAGMTSELLNDYEEGTWTVTWTSLSGTPANTTGYYTKIGRQVFFTYSPGAGTVTATAGSTRFSLPFTPAIEASGTQISQNINLSFTTLILPANASCYVGSFTSNYMVFSGVFFV